MDPLSFARWQFALTSVFHFVFVALTLGLSVFVAFMELRYVRTGDEQYKRMAKFWGKLFLINFTLGVVTGIVQEFQFGMNWSGYSRFVGDIFGVPLAIEALLAFFLESTFIGVWFFGWDVLPKRLHAATITLVAVASNLSALWILIANSWMHRPVGYAIVGGRAQMVDFWAILGNYHVWLQFPHTVLAGLITAAFFVAGVSAWHLLRGREVAFFSRSLKIALVVALVATPLVAIVGHSQAQYIEQVQPMKLAAMEALWQTEKPAGFSVLVIIDEAGHTNLVDIRIPYMLSVLAHNNFTGEVKGLNDLQAQSVAQYGPGNYIPPVFLTYWSFRLMVGLGVAMIVVSLIGAYLWRKGGLEASPRFLKVLVWAIPLPYAANTAGWLVTELGRQPWIVQGLMRIEQATSPNVTAAEVITSLVAYTLIYLVLMGLDFFLLARAAMAGPSSGDAAPPPSGAPLGRLAG